MSSLQKIEPLNNKRVYSGTVTQKGQVTIPVAIRERLGIAEKDILVWEVHTDNEVTVKKHHQLSLDEVFGAVTSLQKPLDFKKMRDDAIEEHIERTFTSK